MNKSFILERSIPWHEQNHVLTDCSYITNLNHLVYPDRGLIALFMMGVIPAVRRMVGEVLVYVQGRGLKTSTISMRNPIIPRSLAGNKYARQFE